MFNRSRAAHAAKRNWRRVFTVAAATTGVIVLSAGAGYTAAQITSADIKNQTIRSADISENGVGASELRHGAAGTAVTSGHIRNNGIRPWDVGDNFEDAVFDEATGVSDKLDSTLPVENDRNRALERVEATAGALVTGSATLVSGGSPDHAVCFLSDEAGNHLAESDTTLANVAHVTLVGVASEAGTVALECHTGDAPGSATDISMSMVDVK